MIRWKVVTYLALEGLKKYSKRRTISLIYLESCMPKVKCVFLRITPLECSRAEVCCWGQIARHLLWIKTHDWPLRWEKKSNVIGCIWKWKCSLLRMRTEGNAFREQNSPTNRQHAELWPVPAAEACGRWRRYPGARLETWASPTPSPATLPGWRAPRCPLRSSSGLQRRRRGKTGIGWETGREWGRWTQAKMGWSARSWAGWGRWW